mgnify:CR=1 FL=1
MSESWTVIPTPENAEHGMESWFVVHLGPPRIMLWEFTLEGAMVAVAYLNALEAEKEELRWQLVQAGIWAGRAGLEADRADKAETENADLRRQLVETQAAERAATADYGGNVSLNLRIEELEDEARRIRWHHNPDAPPEHFCDDCAALRRLVEEAQARANRKRAEHALQVALERLLEDT